MNSKLSVLIIIALNVLFYFIVVDYTWATNFTDKVFLEYQWWRIYSYSFFHISLLHLFLNMCLLFCFTWSKLLNMLKKEEILIIYIFSSAWAALASSFNRDVYFESLGASGAIAGILGMRFICLFRYRKFVDNELSLTYDWIVNALGVLFFVILIWVDGVDNIAHFVGVISGSFITIIIFCKNKFVSKKNYLLLIVLFLLTIFIAWFCYSKNKLTVYGQSSFIFLKNNLDEYNDKAVEFFNEAQSFYSDKKFRYMVNKSIDEIRSAKELLQREILKENKYSDRQKEIILVIKKKFDERLKFFLAELNK